MKHREPSKSFEDLSDIITYLDYAEWTGCGENQAREFFNSRGFPLLPGQGNRKKANKYQVFLFITEDVEMKKIFAKEFARKLIGG